ncbi:MAG: hypothetical protein ABWY95_06730, partial [Thermoleophilaceae bacterium]
TELPGCDEKVAKSIEIPWNLYEDDPAMTASLAGAFAKVEERLDDLRRHERAAGPSTAGALGA